MRIGLLACVRTSQVRRSIYVALLCLPAAACLSAPQAPLAGPDPADPQARVPAVSYRSVLSGYASQRPVEPAPWREQNERVAPSQSR
jgi:hypothetical protein